MARRETTTTIALEGRDKGKVFFLKEMDCLNAERWATRVFLALAKSGVSVPANIMAAGMAGIAVLSLKAFGSMDPDAAIDLLDEMFTCVQFVPNAAQPEVRLALIEGEDSTIEEVRTRFQLREEVLSLHLGFSIAAEIVKQREAMKSSAASSNTRTSRPRSRR